MNFVKVQLLTLGQRKATTDVETIDGELPEAIIFCNGAFVLDKTEPAWLYREVVSYRTKRMTWMDI